MTAHVSWINSFEITTKQYLKKNGSKKVKKIMVTGESGVGKSSILNLLVDTNVAKVSDNANVCSFEYTSVTCWNERIKEYWQFTDAVGLLETACGTVDTEEAVKKLIKFIKMNKDGFNAVLMVIKKGRFTNSFKNNYNFFVKLMLSLKVPCILVVTGCEDDDPMDSWKLDQEKMNDLKMYAFKDVVCGTAKVGGRFEDILVPLRKQTRCNVLKSLKKHLLEEPYCLRAEMSILKSKINGILEWFGMSLRLLSNSYDPLIELLRKHYCLPDEKVNDLKKGFQPVTEKVDNTLDHELTVTYSIVKATDPHP